MDRRPEMDESRTPQDRTTYDHTARSIATEMVVRAMLEMLERTDPSVRDTILRESNTRAAAMTRGMPNADFFRGRVEAALAEIVGTKA